MLDPATGTLHLAASGIDLAAGLTRAAFDATHLGARARVVVANGDHESVHVVEREAGQKGFVVVKERWVVERTFAWLGLSRRLSKDYEVLPEVGEAMVLLASIRLMVRRLA